ncbi:unnamed protein product, partial [Allacma fusca]
YSGTLSGSYRFLHHPVALHGSPCDHLSYRRENPIFTTTTAANFTTDLYASCGSSQQRLTPYPLRDGQLSHTD